MTNRERRVRDLAYQIWEEDGRPEGAEARHWSEAERRYAAELGSAPSDDGADSDAKGKAVKAPKAKAAAAAVGTPPKAGASPPRPPLRQSNRRREKPAAANLPRASASPRRRKPKNPPGRSRRKNRGAEGPSAPRDSFKLALDCSERRADAFVVVR